MEINPAKPPGDRAFITEVGRLSSSSDRRHTHRPSNALLGTSPDKDSSGIRGVEKVNAATAASDVFQIIDKFGEKQQHSKNIRSLIQKAAQKTILVVRTKNATQAAENVTIRFNKAHPTDPPRAVALRDVWEKVLAHTAFSSNRKRYLFYSVFESAPEVDALLKDMFWYLTAHCFQAGRHKEIEQSYYERIADNFTSLFIRVQVQPSSRDSGFVELLPDILAQVLFMALYEGFPKSRKAITHTDLRSEILRTCYCWILGFVPADFDFSHWVSVDQDSPKRIAALADFPAMRNRMLRAERLERTKMEVKNRHGSILNEAEDLDALRDDADNEEYRHGPAHENGTLPVVPSAAATGAAPNNVETYERCVYQMQNSPLVDAFLKRYQLEANTRHLMVQLRMTSSKHFDLKNQEALHPTTLPKERRRRHVNAKAYAAALEKIEGFGDSVRAAYASERQHAFENDAIERRKLAQEHRELETQFSKLKQHRKKIHEYSNLIVSKKSLAPGKELGVARPAQPLSAGCALVPRPPPPRPTGIQK